jgi:hypothetical protein
MSDRLKLRYIAPGRYALTGRIGDDGVEEPTASPGIPCDVEGAQVQDALPNAVLSRGAHDPRLRL